MHLKITKPVTKFPYVKIRCRNLPALPKFIDRGITRSIGLWFHTVMVAQAQHRKMGYLSDRHSGLWQSFFSRLKTHKCNKRGSCGRSLKSICLRSHQTTPLTWHQKTEMRIWSLQSCLMLYFDAVGAGKGAFEQDVSVWSENILSKTRCTTSVGS